jgi:undecaprenyl diphosphate synthase
MTARSPEAPRHVAVIMDGNGRWAEARSLPRIRGHEHGVEAVRSVVRGCRRRGVEALTLYSFSAENWARPKEEVAGLMALLVRFLDEERREILDHGIRLVASGEIERLPAPARLALQGLMRASSGQAGMVLNLALSYGSRQEIVRAARLLADDAKKRRISPNDIDVRRAPLHTRPARPRPRHPHRRRAPAVELPAVPGGLRRAVRHRPAVAGLP